jgi:hypothetical protein
MSYIGSPVSGKTSSETVWKFLVTGQPPHHQTHHSRVDERFAGRAQPLVVLAHPPVVADPGEGSFHDPASRQHLKSPARKQLVEVDAPLVFCSDAALMAQSLKFVGAVSEWHPEAQEQA